MRMFEFNPDRKYAKLKVDNKLDLWHLQNVIEPKDLVTARTLRTIFIQREGTKEKGKKKSVVLTVKVEKVDFHEHSNNLRINGRIVKAPSDVQLGDYHTIEVGIGSVLTVEKQEWKQDQIERLERAKIRMTTTNPRLLEEFYVHVNKDDKMVVYGFEQVKLAADVGAVKVVLIQESKIKESSMEELIKLIESKRGEIKLVSEKEEFGKKFCRTYSIGAILRFPIS